MGGAGIDRRSFLALATTSRVSARPLWQSLTSDPARSGHGLTSRDDELLEEIERRAFRYFWAHGDERTGHVLDRSRADGSRHPQAGIASVAATGYGLTALAIAAERGWERRSAVVARVRSSLRFLAGEMPHEHGWFYHFVDQSSGAREWACELSSIDTALLLAGVLTARQAFASDPRIVEDAATIYGRVDFPWMLNGHPALLSMGWKPESGFLDARWEHYCELMLLYLLALGSPSHPLPAASWHAWRRPLMEWGGFSYISGPDPLFVHQYSHAWIDFRGRKERKTGIDWFANSVTATRAHKAFCLGLAGDFPAYRDDVWGITASDSAKGYVAWGGPPRHPAIDGTVVPCAAGGSLMFAPEICVPVMHALHDRFATAWGPYGFVDAFNPGTNWIDADVLGIDLGITLLSAENLRSGAVWRWFMRNPEIGRAMTMAGLEGAAAGGPPGTSGDRPLASLAGGARAGIDEEP
jgi:hypothetical protein